MAQRALACGLAPELGVAQAALSYVQLQGHLVSCAADLRIYTSRLGPETANWLAQQLLPLTPLPSLGSGGGEAGMEASQQLKAVRKAVCCRQLLDDLGLPRLASAGEAVTHAGGKAALIH